MFYFYFVVTIKLDDVNNENECLETKLTSNKTIYFHVLPCSIKEATPTCPQHSSKPQAERYRGVRVAEGDEK